MPVPIAIRQSCTLMAMKGARVRLAATVFFLVLVIGSPFFPASLLAICWVIIAVFKSFGFVVVGYHGFVCSNPVYVARLGIKFVWRSCSAS